MLFSGQTALVTMFMVGTAVEIGELHSLPICRFHVDVWDYKSSKFSPNVSVFEI